MKRFTAIFFAFIVLFNALGFYGLLVGLKYKAGLDLVARLNKEQYRTDETVTLKVPMALPYHIDKGIFERVDGQIAHQGEFYRLVKQKLEMDTLYIVCIKDNDSKMINQALTDYVKTFTDKPVNNKHTPKYAVDFLKEFFPSFITLSTQSNGWNYSVYEDAAPEFFTSISLSIFSPPPQA
ncbi:MAG: hypothetical protein ABIS36_05025 [Chryseolinea sp.]